MGRGIRNRSGSYDYFFVKPEGRRNVHETAQRLMRIGRIREVVITEGHYGFVVKANTLYGAMHDSLDKEIIDVVGGSFKKVLCHCQYVKA